MARLTLTRYGSKPRLLYRDTDFSTLQARSNNAAGWKPLWDSSLAPGAASLESTQTVAQIASDINYYDSKALLLALVGTIDDISAQRKKAIDAAVYYAQNCAGKTDFSSVNALRAGALGMALTYDILYSDDQMTETARGQIRGGIKTVCTGLSGKVVSTELIDGHAAGCAMALFFGGMAIADEDSAGITHYQKALDHWYGEDPGDPGRIDYDRYYGADGGSGKGSWYSQLSQWYTQLFLRALHNAASSRTYDTEPYDPWSDETWLPKIPEWFLRVAFRQDKDYLALGDTSRITNPVFHQNSRLMWSTFCALGGAWRKQARWVYEQLDSWNVEKNGVAGYQRPYDFVLFDKASADCAPVSPAQASPAIPRARWFSPPGHYHYIHPSWDIPNAADVHIHLPERYYHGHPHLNVGEIQLGVKADRLLLATGVYSTSDPAADYQGTHNNNWAKQSIGHSGVPLVEGQSSDGSDENYNWDENGDRQTYKNGLGGQCWMTIGGLNGTYGPQDISELLSEGGGLAWRRATSAAPATTAPSVADFLTSDARRAYLQDYTDYGGDTERVRELKIRILVLKDVAPWPVIFRVVRVRSRLASMKKRDHWHFARAPALDAQGRIVAYGLYQIGKVTIDYHRKSTFTYTAVGGGAQSDGYGENDFRWGGTNWRPTYATNWRNLADLGHYRMEVSPGVPQEEDFFACVIFPTLAAESPPAYELFEEASWFGVDFSGRQFRIHKTEDQCLLDVSDTEPPQVPQGVAAAGGPGSGEVTLTCTPNADDTVLYRAYYRAKS